MLVTSAPGSHRQPRERVVPATGSSHRDTFEATPPGLNREALTGLSALAGAALLAAATSVLSGAPSHTVNVVESAIAGTGTGALAVGAAAAAIGLAVAPDSHTSGLNAMTFGLLGGVAGGLAGLVAGTLAGASGLIGGPVVAAAAGAVIGGMTSLYATQ